jgi:hypothetical protein
VQLGEDHVSITIRAEAAVASEASTVADCEVTDLGLKLTIPIRLKHRQGAIVIDVGNRADQAGRIDRALVRAVCLARAWTKSLADGDVDSTKEIARQSGLCHHYAARLMPLAWLAPDLVEAILNGRQPRALSLGALSKEPLPLDWDEQRRLFGTVG